MRQNRAFEMCFKEPSPKFIRFSLDFLKPKYLKSKVLFQIIHMIIEIHNNNNKQQQQYTLKRILVALCPGMTRIKCRHRSDRTTSLRFIRYCECDCLMYRY